MSDNFTMSETVKLAVKQQFEKLIGDSTWLESVESKIFEYAKQRLLAKFSNIETSPDLVNIVEATVQQLFISGKIPDIKEAVDNDLVKETLDKSVHRYVEETISRVTESNEWISELTSIVDRQLENNISKLLTEIDLNKLIVEHIDSGITRWQDKFKKDFSTNGITDSANSTQLTVMDDVVVVENELIAKKLVSETDALVAGTLFTNNLVLKGKINLDNSSWNELTDVIASRALTIATEQWSDRLANLVLEKAKTTGIDFNTVTINGSPLLSANKLSDYITESNIEKIGSLKELVVLGHSLLSNTLSVKNKRVGINTQEPESALSIWDEEVSIVIDKHSENTAYIGTAKPQNLVLGINRKPALTIDTSGVTTVKELKIDRFKIGHATEVPGYSGTRGDIVFNSDPKPGAPFAWVCVGGFKWQTVSSLQVDKKEE